MSGSNADADAVDRRSRLLAVKLRALAADHLGRTIDAEPAGYPSGAAFVVDGDAWVLVDGPADRALGPALAWAIRQGAASLNLIADRDTGQLARRATSFRFPIAIWYPEERALLAAPPEPLGPPPDPSPEHLVFGSLIVEAGAALNVEHGVVTGEVRGLEVCRVVAEPTTGRFVELGDVTRPADPVPSEDTVAARLAGRESGEAMLEVGVGPNDREAFQMLHGDIPTVEALAAVVESVAAHRSDNAPGHPLNRMAPERFLRWQATVEPARVGAIELAPAMPPVPRPSMKEIAPCVAIARDAEGHRRPIVFTSGVDLDLVPYVADAVAMSAMLDGTGRTAAIAAPARDIVPVTSQLVDLLDMPVDTIALD